MTARAQRPGAPPPLGRWRALLVLGLLAGLLGMHGLAPTGAGTGHEHGPEHRTVGVSTVQAGCHGEGGGGLHHADPTCKASTVSGGPALPVLVADAVTTLVDADAVRTRPGTAPDGARAPPSLAELQLLRI